MTIDRINKAIKIIKLAIEDKISVQEASKRSGYASTYIKNIKADILDKHVDGYFENEEASHFMDIYELYLRSKKGEDVEVKEDVSIEIDNSITLKSEKLVVGEKLSVKSNGEVTDVEWKGANRNRKDGDESEYDGNPYPNGHIKTLSELLEGTDVDEEIWKVKDYLVNKWDTMTSVRGFPEVVENFQVKAKLERVEDRFKFKTAAEMFIDMVKEYQPPALNLYPKINNVIPSNVEDENNMLEICIFDLHIGKLAWAGETGENYDTKIASERFINAITTLLNRASSFSFKKILFPVGSDFFNSDTIFNTTTRGTQQDEDLRWQKTFRVGSKLIVDGINLLKQTGVPVEVVVIPGNHDFERSFYLGEFLCAWFNQDKQVIVDNGASPRKYKRFGEVLIGYTHGSEEKEGSLAMLMASEKVSKKMWSETEFREWHLGHIHRKRKTNYKVKLDKNNELAEDFGVSVRYMSSLTGTEEWHHKKGFVSQIKAADAFVWNDKLGLVAHLNSNIKIES